MRYSPSVLALLSAMLPAAVALSNPANASLGDGDATARIVNDEPLGQPGQELSHGMSRTLDFTEPAIFRLTQAPYSSYEVVVDATSGDAQPLSLQRLDAGFTTVLGTGYLEGTGGSVVLPVVNLTASVVTNEYIRLTGIGCAPCGADDTYRIRLLDTTLASPRFNNVGTQRSVLLVNNRGKRVANGRAYFWSEAGALLHTLPFQLVPNDVLKVELADDPVLAGKLGSVTIAHDAQYGDLAGKVAALDTVTGFSFSHLMAERGH